mgnify:CR=1 FL=1
MKIKPYMEQFIRDNYLTMTQKELAKALGENVTAGNVQHWLKKNNLWKEKYMFSDEIIKFMIDNYQTMKYSEIAEHVGLTERQVRGKLNNMGYTKIREFNKGYFNNIDSELKAYFLGFIFADGWVVHNKQTATYEFGMELQSSDKYILESLNKELGGVHIITHSNPTQRVICGVLSNIGHMDRLRIYSKEFVEDLMKCGIVPNKTYNYELPVFPMEYFFDFLRGYIDGDGCYSYVKNRLYMSLTCASENILRWIQFVLNSYNISTNVYKEKEYKYKLSCTNYDSMSKLINFMYHDNCTLYLTRKYNKIKPLLMPSHSEMIG